MAFPINSNVVNAVDPPIAEAQSWIAGRKFQKNKPLLNLAQAVPSYPPANSMSEHLANNVKLFETAQYTAIAGIPALRGRLASNMMISHGGRIEPEIAKTSQRRQKLTIGGEQCAKSDSNGAKREADREPKGGKEIEMGTKRRRERIQESA